jgi:hypothetical protein
MNMSERGSSGWIKRQDAEESTGGSLVRLSDLEALIVDEHDRSSTERATLPHWLGCYV